MTQHQNADRNINKAIKVKGPIRNHWRNVPMNCGSKVQK